MRSHNEPLDASWAASLLSAPSASSQGSVYDRLLAAQEELRAAKEEVERALTQNPLTSVVAAAAMDKAGRKGKPSVQVTDAGVLTLIVEYGQESPGGRPRRSWKSELPSLAELRGKADSLGIDHASFGRSKRKIQEAINKAEALLTYPQGDVVVSETPKKPMVKTATAIEPVKVVNFPTKKSKGRLSQLGKLAKSVDLESIRSETPEGFFKDSEMEDPEPLEVQEPPKEETSEAPETPGKGLEEEEDLDFSTF